MEENNYLISYVTCGNEYYLSACRVRIGLEMDVTLIEEYMKIERVVSKKLQDYFLTLYDSYKIKITAIVQIFSLATRSFFI